MVSAMVSVVLLVVLACAAIGKSAESGVWEGFFTFGGSINSFQPCGSRDTWWMKSLGYSRSLEELQEKYNQIAERPYTQIYLRFKGEVSKKGQYGRLGSYQRVAYIGEILEVRAKQDSDCA